MVVLLIGVVAAYFMMQKDDGQELTSNSTQAETTVEGANLGELAYTTGSGYKILLPTTNIVETTSTDSPGAQAKEKKNFQVSAII